jgi:hypothetical protein
VRQRNDTGQPLTVHTDPPQLLEPGDEVDHDTYVIGLTLLDPPPEAPTVETGEQPDTSGQPDTGGQPDPTQPPKPARAGRNSTAKEATN